MKTRDRERRDSGILIILILLLGFICIILASGWALRFAPNWRLDTNMGSNLNPNSEFLTNQPVSFIEPIDPAILTNPIWINGYLTPGALFATRIPLSTATSTIVPPKTSTPVPTLTAVPTNTFVVVVIPPTNTKIYIPPPPVTATNTPVPPPPSADLQITKTDNATDYEAGGQTAYTIVASNSGTSNVTGAVVMDNIPTQIATWTWVCNSQTGGATGCDGVTGSNINFTDVVDLPSGATITYIVTANISAGAIGDLINTANINVPAGMTDPNLLNNSATDTDLLVTFNCFPPPFPYGNIGTSPDGSASTLMPGFLTLRFCAPSPSLVVNSDTNYDLVYYPEYPPNPPIPPTLLEMDLVILEIGDGSNWYRILYWGNGSADANTDIPGFPPNSTDCTGEPDNCLIDVALLNVSSPYPGISIDLDSITPAIPPGTYPYIRIISLPDGVGGDGVDVDAIAILP